MDIRGHTLNDAMMFAKAEKLLVGGHIRVLNQLLTVTSISPPSPLLPSLLQGVNVDSSSLLANPDLIASVRAKKLVLFTWGEENNTLGSITLQKKEGVAAVIYDRWAVGATSCHTVKSSSGRNPKPIFRQSV